VTADALGYAPDLSGARCAGRSDLFDPLSGRQPEREECEQEAARAVSFLAGALAALVTSCSGRLPVPSKRVGSRRNKQRSQETAGRD
jgi:hypothetical protein